MIRPLTWKVFAEIVGAGVVTYVLIALVVGWPK